MRVENISKHPDTIPVLAEWHFDQWSDLYPDDTLESFTADLRESLTDAVVPSTWVLLDDNDVCWGSASIIEQDMTTNLELGPWLASVYIHSDLRGQRLGQLVVKTVMEEAAKAGLKELYLFTPGQEYFYQTLSWQTLKHERYQGQDVAIMRAELKL